MVHLCFVKQLSNEEVCLYMPNKRPKSMKKFKQDLLSMGYKFMALYSNRQWFDMGNHYTPSERQIHIEFDNVQELRDE